MTRAGIILGALTLSTAIVASPSPATMIVFNVNGLYTNGGKTGQTFSATVSYDNTQTPTLFPAFSNANENYYIIPSFTFTNAVNLPAVETPVNIGVQDALNSSQNDGFIFNLSQFNLKFFSTSYQAFSGPTVPTLNMLTVFNKTFDYYGSSSSEVGSGTFTITPVLAPVPEPASWALMVTGFGAIGGAARYRRRAGSVASA